jgi:sugar phosphate isomerase/epimerase
MNSSRRSFIKNTSFAIAGTAFFSNYAFAGLAKKKLTGLQLYSVRDDMKADALGTLKQLSKMGYKHVEHANYVNRKFYGYSAAEFKKILNDLDLKMPSGHTVMRSQHWDATAKDFTSEWKYTVEDAALLEQQFVISPWMDENLRKDYDKLMGLLELFNKSGELCKKSGMRFGYHNHDFEFNTKVKDELLYDLILKHTDPSLVIQQLDIGNMLGAGGDALEVIKKYPGRFISMHVKDEIKSAKGEMNSAYESTVLGKGVMPVKQIIDLGLKTGGTEHFIIEQESYQGQKPLDAMKADLAIMKKWGYK